MGQNQWYNFGVGAPPSLVYFSGDWDVHCHMVALYQNDGSGPTKPGNTFDLLPSDSGLLDFVADLGPCGRTD